MGACCTATSKHDKRSRKSNSSGVKVEEIPDERSIDDAQPAFTKEKPIQIYLTSGNTRQIQELIDRNEISVHDYIFGGSDKTILHEAVQTSENFQVIETILNNKADVNAVEKETGNTALILAALDLKVDIVKSILKYNPNIRIKNRKGQDIFEFLNDYLIEKKGTKKTDLTAEQRGKLQTIIELLNEYKIRNENIEDLDEEERRVLFPSTARLNESGNLRNRM